MARLNTVQLVSQMTETIHRVLRIEANRPMIVANNLKMGFYGQVGVVKASIVWNIDESTALDYFSVYSAHPCITHTWI